MATKQPVPPPSETLLLHPINLEILERLRAGADYPPAKEPVLKPYWSPEQQDDIQRSIKSWLKTGHLTPLISLLQQHPTAIAHPCIFWQLFHLRGLLQQNDVDDITDMDERGWGYDADQPILPRGIKQQAQDQLHQIFAAWISQMLAGYTVTPFPLRKRRGRTPKWDIEDRIFMLSEFAKMSEALNVIEDAGPSEVAPMRNEPESKFLRRMEAVTQDLNKLTIEYFFAAQKNWATLDKPPVKKKAPPILSKKIVSMIVRQAWKGKRLSKNALLYGILAHHYQKDCRKIETIRGLIEHAEADFPALDSRRDARSSTSNRKTKPVR